MNIFRSIGLKKDRKRDIFCSNSNMIQDIISLFSLPKNSNEFDRGLYLSKPWKVISLLLFWVLPPSIVFLFVSKLPYPFDWYLIVLSFLGSLFANGFYFWAKGGVFFLFSWFSCLLSFRLLPFLFTLYLPTIPISFEDVLPPDLKESGRVLHVINFPIQPQDISKQEFTIRTNYLFGDKKPGSVSKNYHDSDHEYQFAPVYGSADGERDKPLFLAYANAHQDWNFSSDYYMIPIKGNFVWGSYLNATCYFPELVTGTLFIGTPVSSILWIRILGFFLFIVIPALSFLLVLKIHPGLWETRKIKSK